MLPSFTVNFVTGDTVPFKLTVTADETGQPLGSLEGYDLWMTAKLDPSVADAAAQLRFSTVTGDARDGLIKRDGVVAWWEIPPALSATLVAKIPFDVQIRTPTGRIDTLVPGQLKPRSQITRTA